MKKKVIKILCIVFGIPLGLILLAVLFFAANDIYQQLPHHITDVEEIQYLIPYFEDMPIESCDCRWEADVIFMGGALETHSSGKITVSQEYYDSLLEMYAEWGVDFIKCDDICNTNIYPHNPYSATRAAAFLLRL